MTEKKKNLSNLHRVFILTLEVFFIPEGIKHQTPLQSCAQGPCSERGFCSVSSTWCPCSPHPLPLLVPPTGVMLLGPHCSARVPRTGAGHSSCVSSLTCSCSPALLSLSTVSAVGGAGAFAHSVGQTDRQTDILQCPSGVHAPGLPSAQRTVPVLATLAQQCSPLLPEPWQSSRSTGFVLGPCRRSRAAALTLLDTKGCEQTLSQAVLRFAG